MSANAHPHAKIRLDQLRQFAGYSEQWILNEAEIRKPEAGTLSEVYLPARDFMLQSRSQLVHIAGGDIYRHVFRQ